MSTTANPGTACEGENASYGAADAAQIAKLLRVFTISIAMLVFGVVAASLSDAPQWIGLLAGLSAMVLMATTIWLAFAVYSRVGGMIVLLLLVTTSLLTALTSLAPLAILGKLFVLLSVRDKAAKLLKKPASPRRSVDAGGAPDLASSQHIIVKPRFAWEQWLFGAVITTLVGTVAYSAYLSILEANL